MILASTALTAQAATAKQVLKDETGAVHTVIGTLGKVAGATAEARALSALDLVKGDFGFAAASGTFAVLESHKDENGATHTRLNQVINGIPVVGHQMIVHESNGSVFGVNGRYDRMTATADKATLTGAQATEKAVAHTGYTGELSRPATASLAYLPQGKQAVLTYAVSVAYLGDAPGNWTIYVNAVDGAVVSAINSIEAAATGTGVLGDTKQPNTTLKNGAYYLEDRTKYMYTQKGSKLMLGVHYSTRYNNAFWDGAQLVFGDGDGATFAPLSGALDLVAHEYSHAVIQSTSGLIYQGQSGALAESWSDAMAAAADGSNWLIGEAVYTPAVKGDALRSLENPALYGQPAHMSQYVNTTSDNGGVHTNSGIPNKAFYNFATAIGSRTVAAKIWYTANRDYMISRTNFSGARAATLQAAASLYGSSSSYYTALQNAWSAVGVN